MNHLQPLSHLRVLNTRPAPQNRQTSKKIEILGGHSIELPALSIEKIRLSATELMPSAKTKCAIFISPNAVRCYFEQLNAQEYQWNEAIQVFATGKGTADALLQWRVKNITFPSKADSENLLKTFNLTHFDNHDEILLVKGKNGRTLIQEIMKEQGLNLKVIEVYQRCLPQYSQAFIDRLWQDNLVDIILFTSQQGIQQFFQMFENAKTWVCSKPCIVLSERLKEVAIRHGMKAVFVSSYDKIIESLCDYNKGIRDAQS